jgi:actin-related protein
VTNWHESINEEAPAANISAVNKQPITYAWSKGCTWAVLSNFETIKIFNAEWQTSDYSQNHFKTIRAYNTSAPS